MTNERIAWCSEVICDDIEARLAKANAKWGNANADDNDVLSTCSWIMNEPCRQEYECATTHIITSSGEPWVTMDTRKSHEKDEQSRRR